MNIRLFPIAFIILILTAAIALSNSWNERSNDFVKLFYHPEDAQNVSGLLETFKTVKPDLEEKLGVKLRYIPQIYVVSSQEEFDRATGGSLPGWSQGVSFPRGGQIVLKSPSFSHDIQTFNRTAVHELVHLMVAQKAGNRVPRWLNEGLAQLLAGEAQGKPLMPLSRALWAGKLLALTSIEHVDQLEKTEAELAYLQSYHSTEFLLQEYGWETLRQLLQALGSGLSWDEALFQHLETDQSGFETSWRARLEKSYRWIILMDTPIYLFMGATVLVLLAVIMVFIRRRQTYKRWESEDGINAGTM